MLEKNDETILCENCGTEFSVHVVTEDEEETWNNLICCPFCGSEMDKHLEIDDEQEPDF